jgi:hypothetical protein
MHTWALFMMTANFGRHQSVLNPNRNHAQFDLVPRVINWYGFGGSWAAREIESTLSMLSRREVFHNPWPAYRQINVITSPYRCIHQYLSDITRLRIHILMSLRYGSHDWSLTSRSSTAKLQHKLPTTSYASATHTSIGKGRLVQSF